jgi:hypothetical protein
MLDANEIVTSAMSQETSEQPEGETVKPEESSGSKLDALSLVAKRERKFLEEQRKFSEERKRFMEEQEKLKEDRELLQLLNDNPLEVLKRKNIDISSLNERFLETAEDDEIDPLHKKIKELESKLSQYEGKFSSLEEKEIAQIKAKESESITQVKQAIDQTIKADTERFELVNSLGEQASDQIFEIMQEMFNESKKINPNNPTILKPDEAAELLEDYLAKELKQALKLNKVKKFLSSDDDTEQDIMQQAVKQSVTLDDSFNRSTQAETRELSEEERVRQATKLAQSMLF